VYTVPKRLRSGSRVAIIAPASPFKTDELIAGLDVIKAAGLEPVLGPNVRGLKTWGIHSAPTLDRAEEMMWAFTDPDIDGVITVTGGLGSGAVLPYLDFDRIKASRRVLIGISDITAINNGLLAGAGLINVNGQYPSIRIDEGEFIRNADCESLKFTLQMLMSDQEWGERPFDINQYLPRTVCPGKARGHVVGGNLDTLCTLMGTPFAPDFENAILFVEDVHKDGEVIARLLLHLRLAGVFDKVAGIVIGEFVDVPLKQEGKVPSIEDVLQEYLSQGPPCSYGYSFSHGPYTIPIPIGAMCEMDADTGSVSFKFTMGR
jgi:muramoyltetrapeptide carboxypeptidase